MRIAQLVIERQKVFKRGSKKLTDCNKTFIYYFRDLFDGIDPRRTFNYYYQLFYLTRRISFVFTALYMTEYPHW